MSMTKENVLEIKAEIELHIQKADHLAGKLREAGFIVESKPDGTIYVYKEVREEYGERPRPAPRRLPSYPPPEAA